MTSSTKLDGFRGWLLFDNLRLRWQEYRQRRSSRDIMLDFGAIKPTRKMEPQMPRSTQWETAKYEDAGDRAAQFVACDRCGHRDEDIVKRGRTCTRARQEDWPYTIRPCGGTLRGVRTVGF